MFGKMVTLMRSRIIFCIIIFYVVPQGNAKSIRIDTSIEVGKNITGLLQNLQNYLQGLQTKSPDYLQQLIANAQNKQVKDEASDQVKERIVQLIKNMANNAGAGVTTPSPFQAQIQAVYESKTTEMNWLAFWEALKKMVNNIAQSLDNKPSQVIVQEAEEKRQFSLLQNIKSGRVRGPVHVYGQHSGSKEDD
ncbi:uncharacterized protein LOC125233558 [Leguminivora glycinivorella]|uniref:uncharacterized protein LOC125233558 n=1 Tax=Leguminivora glycinivorella TaxID=1035111 RepID=UPI00200D7C64|nr:uncharacterized protein LOC125233558 [Leguminivora glycinivorella]